MPVPLDQEHVLAVLAAVKDPEIPTISVVDLGMVERVEVSESAPRLTVELIPTFLGCPALEVIRGRVLHALVEAFELDQSDCLVKFGLSRPWSSDRVSATGRERLRAWGMAPPPMATVAQFVEGSIAVACPLCQSLDTEVQNLFGSAACRALYYCRSCRNPFEVMKPI